MRWLWFAVLYVIFLILTCRFFSVAKDQDEQDDYWM